MSSSDQTTNPVFTNKFIIGQKTTLINETFFLSYAWGGEKKTPQILVKKMVKTGFVDLEFDLMRSSKMLLGSVDGMFFDLFWSHNTVSTISLVAKFMTNKFRIYKSVRKPKSFQSKSCANLICWYLIPIVCK